jgi:N-acetyl-alpha-D-muramate 1-phosphate uridylyltransferase
MMGLGEKAFVLAAGLGLRMRPLTLTTPKPLVKVAGKPLIAYAMDKLGYAGVSEAVVNVHHLANQIEEWCKAIAHPRITISDERGALLDTGGGIAKALPLLGHDPFFVLNSDSFWTDGKVPALERLRGAWRDDDMDCLLLLCDPVQTTGYDGAGDFVMDDGGRLTWAKQFPDRKALTYIGCYLVHPRLFERAPSGAFSMLRLWDHAIENGRLFGLAHDGHWLHVGTVESIAAAEDYLRQA